MSLNTVLYSHTQVANSFALAVQNYYYDQEDYWGNVLMRETEIVFTLFFTLECAIKARLFEFKSWLSDCGLGLRGPSICLHPRSLELDRLLGGCPALKQLKEKAALSEVVGLLDALRFEALSFLKPAQYSECPKKSFLKPFFKFEIILEGFRSHLSRLACCGLCAP